MPTRSGRRGFTLIENLIAAALLGVMVLAVGLAVSSTQKASEDGQEMILGSMAADDLLSELRAEPYATLPTYNGMNQPVGSIQTLSGDAYPDTYWAIGRSVLVEDVQYQDGGLGTKINGRRLVVSAFDDNRTLLQLETFVPEPAP